MIKIGEYNILKPVRNTSVGVFLGDDEGTEILLPNKYVPKDFEFEKSLEVFCYLDHEERPVATTLTPKIKRDAFAYLEVADINKFGAFLDWGLEKQLFVPYREQHEKMEVGKAYLVYCFLDEKSFRIVASSRLDKFLSNQEVNFKVGDEVNLTFWRKTNLGWEVIVNKNNKALIYHDAIFGKVDSGFRTKGFVKKIREDDKIDVSLQPEGIRMLEPTADLIYNELIERGGYLKMNDKSSPEEIRLVFGISKKAFKKGLGVLYKAKKIIFENEGIRST
ncbi:CvfB family protein [Croceivirga thetidis]|uniref:GntR family transcriptional regulator n=1 Tax=Croceivirga thetidis TaxID=2721623 RepID=A0ABX1GR53_9FLAO|nr:S1-like domain-containing RNA-binding protein [Croceivirga thetidis]NKI32103.1 GntR family transcriptional regulator [Croceivirga thetidis]